LGIKIKGITLIVLKTTQDAALAALQTVANIVDRRHTLPILHDVLIIKSDSQRFLNEPCFANVSKLRTPQLRLSQSGVTNTWIKTLFKRGTGFFTATKLNLRNAP
jgi:hypothetical protein